MGKSGLLSSGPWFGVWLRQYICPAIGSTHSIVLLTYEVDCRMRAFCGGVSTFVEGQRKSKMYLRLLKLSF